MSVTIQSNKFNYKDPTTGNYTGLNAVAEAKLSEHLAALEAKGQDVIDDIPPTYTDLSNIVAESYDSTKSYLPGSYVRHYSDGHDKLYCCLVDASDDEEWDEEHWAEAKIGGSLEDINGALRIDTDLEQVTPPGQSTPRAAWAIGGETATQETVSAAYYAVPPIPVTPGELYYLSINVPGTSSGTGPYAIVDENYRILAKKLSSEVETAKYQDYVSIPSGGAYMLVTWRTAAPKLYKVTTKSVIDDLEDFVEEASDEISDLGSEINTIKTNNLGYRNELLIDSYSDNNVTNVNLAYAPFVLKETDYDYSDKDIIRVDLVATAIGSLSFGYIPSSDVVNDAVCDYGHLVYTHTIQLTETGKQIVEFETPLNIPSGYSLIVGDKNNDTASFYYGRKGQDKGLYIINSTKFLYRQDYSINMNFIFYNSVDCLELRNDVDHINATYGKQFNRYLGKRLSIIGDSISAYVDDLPEGNRAYYTGINSGVSSSDEMWYNILCQNLGMTLLVNNSWSGSCVTSGVRSDTAYKPASSPDRCENLDKDGYTPDVIIVAIGTNDYTYIDSNSQFGDWTETVPLGTEADLSDYNNTTFKTAYATMLARIRKKYPNAIIFCASMWFTKRRYSDTGVIYLNRINKSYTDFTNAAHEIAKLFGCLTLDVGNIGFNRYNYFPTYCDDTDGQDTYSEQPTHPNRRGHRVIAEAVTSQLLTAYASIDSSN